jgi:acyl-CoA synthetase (AMP-forming)/AMP-acid ligase II
MAPATLLDGLARSVDACADAPAVVWCGREVSYADLWRRIGSTAHALRAAGVNRGERVVLVVPNSPDYIMGFYGVLAAGAVAVPIMAESRPGEVSAATVHSEAGTVLVTRRWPHTDELRARVAPDVRLIEVETLAEASHAGWPQVDAAPDRLACLLYTSGTTAGPKGVMLSHRNLASNAAAIVEYLDLTSSDRVLAVLPFPYAYGNSVLQTHLLAGATIVIGGGMMYPQHVVGALREANITGFSAVPWMFRTLLDRTSFGRTRGELPALRYLTQAGGRMREGDIRRLVEAFPGVRFFAMYGQTEATARLTYLPPGDVTTRPASVGLAIPGVRLGVRDAHDDPLPPGEVGEVVATGPNVMMGYWRDEPATEAAIFEEDGARWLRTGDLGYLDADRYLYLVGRRSEIIKTAGFRVSPSEIEAVVLALPGVGDAAACAVPDDQLEEAILLIVVPDRCAPLAEQDVLAHCRAHLSAHKCPRHVVFAPELPRTASGKVQRRLLPAAIQSGVCR